MPSPHQKQLDSLERSARKEFDAKHAAREQAYQLSRATIRGAANTIRAVHRHELPQARQLLQEVAASVKETRDLLKGHPDLYHTGYVQDAQKEYAEASATLAFVAGEPVATPRQLAVELPAYLNGLAEAASELRRYILDALRGDDASVCEPLLETMDEVYSLLVSLDFPEAVTGGLRRTTDALRGVLERTRGDLTLALRQRSLEQRLTSLEEGRGLTTVEVQPAPDIFRYLVGCEPRVARDFQALRQAVLNLGPDVVEVQEKGRVVYRRRGINKPRGWQNFCAVTPQRRQVKVFLGPKTPWKGQRVKTDKNFAWYLLTPGAGRRKLNAALALIQRAYASTAT